MSNDSVALKQPGDLAEVAAKLLPLIRFTVHPAVPCSIVPDKRGYHLQHVSRPLACHTPGQVILVLLLDAIESPDM